MLDAQTGTFDMIEITHDEFKQISWQYTLSNRRSCMTLLRSKAGWYFYYYNDTNGSLVASKVEHWNRTDRYFKHED